MDRIKINSFANAPRVKHAACVRVVVAGCFGVVAACAQAAAPTPVHPAPLTFAIASDVVDKSADDTPLRQMIDALGRERDLSLVIYDGNLKSETQPCNDTFYEARRRLFDTSRKPVVLLPGGNDWATCGLSRAGNYDPVERLDFIRQTFFGDSTALGQAAMPVIRESDVARFRPFHENVRWQAGGIEFVGLNTPAPNNHFLSAGGRNGEFEDRSVANTFWLEHAAESARRSEMRAIVVVLQGDPDFMHYERRDRFAWLRFSRSEEKRDGFLELKRALVRVAEAFHGPLIVIHDSNAQLANGFRIDQPLRNDKGVVVTNLTRIEMNLKKPQSQWLEVTADFEWRAPFHVRVRDVIIKPATTAQGAPTSTAATSSASSTPATPALPATPASNVEDGAPGPSSFFQEMQPVQPPSVPSGSEQPASDATPPSTPSIVPMPPLLNKPADLPPLLPSQPTDSKGAASAPATQ
ncbi:hypothetical protein [Caballeronia sp.]|uniref:hypothetical protein n=1 Tax=Caballeronia sp. TaxID=1931223 RepID=UPI003C701E06